MNDGLSVALRPLPSLSRLEEQWRDAGAGEGGSFFTAWPWVGTWLASLPPAVVPYMVRLEEDGEFRGCAIAVRSDSRCGKITVRRRLYINATGNPALDCLTIEHNGFAGRSSDDPLAWRSLLQWFRSGAAQADELFIPGVTCRIGEADLGGRLWQDVTEVPAYRVDLGRVRAAGGTAGILSANSRQQLNRSMRALAAVGPLKLTAAEDVDEGMAYFDALKRLHIRSWTRRGRDHAFTHPFSECFHRRLIKACIASGEVELLRLTAGSHEFGYLYNFRYRGAVYSYQSGFDDEDRGLRPGYIAHALAIERSAATGALTYDFMAGSNRLKQSFATECYPMRWYRFQRPLLRFVPERTGSGLKQLARSGYRRIRNLDIKGSGHAKSAAR
jgi:hypothetical protein